MFRNSGPAPKKPTPPDIRVIREGSMKPLTNEQRQLREVVVFVAISSVLVFFIYAAGFLSALKYVESTP